MEKRGGSEGNNKRDEWRVYRGGEVMEKRGGSEGKQ